MSHCMMQSILLQSSTKLDEFYPSQRSVPFIRRQSFNRIMLHVDINKLHVNITMLHAYVQIIMRRGEGAQVCH